MKNCILFLVVLILVPIVVISFKKNKTNFSLPKKNDIIVKVKDNQTEEITNIDLEKYIVGVVAAEMPASFHEEALKAQAVAARTFALYKMNNSSKNYDLVTDVTDQSFITLGEMKNKWGTDFEKYYRIIENCVLDTESQIMKYNNEIISAYYFAMSNGYTEEASLVFNENKPYLESVSSAWENENLKNFQVEQQFSKEEFCILLEIECENLFIEDIERSSSNRVNKIVINNIPFIGTDIRKKLSLRSTDFNITFSNNTVSITTFGYGHGVGMSQYGANEMAKNGYNYTEILKYYYKDIIISKI